jgi:hypothetical protein
LLSAQEDTSIKMPAMKSELTRIGFILIEFFILLFICFRICKRWLGSSAD